VQAVWVVSGKIALLQIRRQLVLQVVAMRSDVPSRIEPTVASLCLPIHAIFG
jgi:hypothetical protein